MKVLVWMIVSTLLWAGTLAGINGVIPQWITSAGWWVIVLMTLRCAMDWDIRPYIAAQGRSVHWVVEYANGFGMIAFLVCSGWSFTAIAVVLHMMLEELIFSTDPAS